MSTITMNATATKVPGGFRLDWTPSTTDALGAFLIHTRPSASSGAWTEAELPASTRTTVIKASVPTDWSVRALTASGSAHGTITPGEEPRSRTTFALNSGHEAADIAACEHLGAKVTRVEIAASSLGTVGSVLAPFTAAGIKVILLVGFYGSMITPSQCAEGGKIAHEHAAALRAIEFGNETSYGYQYNDGVGKQSYRERARTYAARAKELSAAMAGSGVPLFAQADDGNSGSNEWVEQMFSAVPDLASHVDAWVAHTYGPGGISKLERVYRFLLPHVTAPRIAITEDGIATDDGIPLSDDYGYPTNLSYAQAAADFEAHVATVRRFLKEALDTFVIYQDRDQHNHGESNGREYFFGALTRAGNPKGPYTPTVEALLAS